MAGKINKDAQMKTAHRLSEELAPARAAVSEALGRLGLALNTRQTIALGAIIGEFLDRLASGEDELYEGEEDIWNENAPEWKKHPHYID